jgi:hypothetical protein
MNASTYTRVSSTVSTTRKSQARIACAWAAKNCRQLGPARRGVGSLPVACRISHTVEAAIVYSSRASSPWIRLWPQVGFSRAIRRISVLSDATVDGRPGRRRSVKLHFRATRLRCQRKIVAGVTGKTSALSGAVHQP